MAEERNDTRSHIQRIRLAAIEGNPAAQFIHKKLPFIGSWNVQAMEDDFLMGRLKPPTEDPLDDPYFNMPYELEVALQGQSFAEDYDLMQWIETIFAENWKLFEYSTPKARPTFIKTSLQIYFEHCAEKHLNAFYLAFIMNFFVSVFLALQAIHSSDLNAILVVTGLIIVLIDLPAGLMVWFIKHHKTLPLCSCKTLQLGIQNRTRFLHEDDKLTVNNSLQQHPWFTRHSISILKAYFWFILILIVPALLLAGLLCVDPDNTAMLILPIIGRIRLIPFVFFWFFCSFHALIFIFAVDYCCDEH